MKNREFRELQVSSTHLAVIFLGILIIGIVIFLLGVSVGKKHAQVAQKAAATAQKEPEQVKNTLVIPENPPTAAPLKKEEPAAKTETAPPKPEVSAPAKEMLAAKPKVESEKASPQTKRTPPKVETKSAQPASAPKKGLYYVQVGALAEKQEAVSVSQRYKTQGYPVVVLDPLPSDQKVVFRVRIGGFATRAEAESVRVKLASATTRKVDHFIVRD
jgi:cell division septation protein DedD